MPQPFIITGNVEFSGDPVITVQERDRTQWLTWDVEMPAIGEIVEMDNLYLLLGQSA